MILYSLFLHLRRILLIKFIMGLIMSMRGVNTTYPFGKYYFCQLILLFGLFFTIYEFYCTILANFYFCLRYFQQKNFNFNKNKWIPNRPYLDMHQKYYQLRCKLQWY